MPELFFIFLVEDESEDDEDILKSDDTEVRSCLLKKGRREWR